MVLKFFGKLFGFSSVFVLGMKTILFWRQNREKTFVVRAVQPLGAVASAPLPSAVFKEMAHLKRRRLEFKEEGINNDVDEHGEEVEETPELSQAKKKRRRTLRRGGLDNDLHEKKGEEQTETEPEQETKPQSALDAGSDDDFLSLCAEFDEQKLAQKAKEDAEDARWGEILANETWFGAMTSKDKVCSWLSSFAISPAY